jgi:hypothetical protein
VAWAPTKTKTRWRRVITRTGFSFYFFFLLLHHVSFACSPPRAAAAGVAIRVDARNQAMRIVGMAKCWDRGGGGEPGMVPLGHEKGEGLQPVLCGVFLVPQCARKERSVKPEITANNFLFQ